jgi:hypothetical protein
MADRIGFVSVVISGIHSTLQVNVQIVKKDGKTPCVLARVIREAAVLGQNILIGIEI